jgi:hypothetical protein
MVYGHPAHKGNPYNLQLEYIYILYIMAYKSLLYYGLMMIEDHPPIWVYDPSLDAQHADESTLTAASGTRGGYPSFDHATPKRGLLGTTSPPKL